MTSVERTADGLVLHFPDHPGVRADLTTFVVDEKRCCEFWGFEILDRPDGVGLRWDGPPAASELLNELHTFFESGGPISLLQGLL